MNEQLDTSDLDAVLDGILARIEPTEAELGEAGAFILRRILARARRGVDVYGNPFDAYARATVRSRSRRGRRTDRVTLSDTGRMMASATWRASPDEVLLYFASRTEGRKAGFHNEGTRHMPRREFFAASEDDLARAGEVVADRIARRLDA
jgi:hypothetical protein